MRNTYFKLWVHALFCTEPNCALIADELSALFLAEIKKRFEEQGCEVAAIGGTSDHVHVIFAQNPLLSLHETIQFVRGISQRWYHLRDFRSSYYKFRWADGYWAYSVSPSAMRQACAFVAQQRQFHARVSLSDEIAQLSRLHNLDGIGP